MKNVFLVPCHEYFVFELSAAGDVFLTLVAPLSQTPLRLDRLLLCDLNLQNSSVFGILYKVKNECLMWRPQLSVWDPLLVNKLFIGF
jgi:hypothetical protein